MTIDDGHFDPGGGFDVGDAGYDEPIVDPLAAAWVDLDLRHPTTGVAEPAERRRPRRNDPCPCGSGKKFKQCCIHAKYPTRRSRSLWLVLGMVGTIVGLSLVIALLAQLF